MEEQAIAVTNLVHDLQACGVKNVWNAISKTYWPLGWTFKKTRMSTEMWPLKARLMKSQRGTNKDSIGS